MLTLMMLMTTAMELMYLTTRLIFEQVFSQSIFLLSVEPPCGV